MTASTCPTCGAPARHMPPDGDFRFVASRESPLHDGSFSCVPAFAVKVAHLMSCAQACYDEDSTGVTEVLEDYLRGTKSEDECIATFYAEWPKVFAGARHD